jgi:hypothetical protein
MGYLGHLRIILTPSAIVPSGHPQIVLNYGRNAGVRDARGHRLGRVLGRGDERASPATSSSQWDDCDFVIGEPGRFESESPYLTPNSIILGATLQVWHVSPDLARGRMAYAQCCTRRGSLVQASQPQATRCAQALDHALGSKRSWPVEPRSASKEFFSIGRILPH